jgi:hypothetical protein
MDITTPEGRREYVFSEWPTIAAYAYTGYQKYGRGILVIECSATAPTDDIKYWHEEAAEEAGVSEQVAAYNPEQEILVGFSFADDNQFARFRPDDPNFAPPLMAAQAPAAEELWEDAE